MSIALVKHAARRGFTLLEILLAVGILGMMAMVVYRFVATNIIALQISTAENAAEAQYNGFIRLVTAQLQDLPTGMGALAGEPYKFNDQSRDEMAWICGGGPGVATRYAPGEWLVRMRLRPMKEGSDKMEIGFLRKPEDALDDSTEGESWVPLLEDVRSMEIRYFDPRVNVWQEKWTDPTVPPLVRLTVDWAGKPPREAVIALRRTPLPIIIQLPPMPQAQPVAPGQLPPGQAPPGQAPPGKQPQAGQAPPKK